MFAPAFERFVAPARGRPQIWRLVVGLALAAVIYALTSAGIVAAAVALLPLSPEAGALPGGALSGDRPVSLLILLSTFVGMALGPMVAARLLHGRAPGSLFGRAPVVLRDFGYAAGIAGAVLAVSVLVWSLFNEAVPGLPLETWIAFLPLTLLAIALQTGGEELLFRGYLQQQLAARFQSPIVWAVLPAVTFGFLHFDAISAGDSVWLVVGTASLFGLMAADLTARTGSIGAAWGFHFANNTLALAVIATEGTLTGLALFRTPYDVSEVAALRATLPLDLAVMVVIWFLIRRVLGR